MIALIPEDPAALAVPGGDPEDQLHVTLAYLGDDVSNLSEATRAALKQHVQQFAQATPPVEARIMGHALWNPDGGPNGDMDACAVYQIQPHPALDEIRDFALMGAKEHLGADMPEQHPGFLPHVTAGYGIKPDALSYTGPVTFNRVRLALGGEVHDFELTPGYSGPAVGGPQQEVKAFATATSPAETNPAETAPVPKLDESNGIPVTFPVIILEGMETSDHRFIEPGALTHRALPLPILAQTANPEGGDGHAGAEVIGRLDVLTRTHGPETVDPRTGEILIDKETGEPFPEGTYVWGGKGFVDPESNGAKLAKKRYLTGNSADLSDVEAEFVWGDGETDDGTQGPQQIRMTAGKIAATTLVPIPAFAQAYVVIDGEEVIPNEETITAAAGPAWVAAELGDDCFLCAAGIPAGFAAPSQEKRDKAAKEGHALPDGSYPIETVADLDKAIKAVGRGGADHDKIRKHIIAQAKRLGVPERIPSNWNPDGSLTASAVAQLLPPAHAFADPVLSELTPLTLDDSSIPGYIEVYGHLAGWGTCHTGFAGQCVTPPRSRHDYGYFNVGAVRTHDAGEVKVVAAGHITMGEGGHAGLKLSASEAAAYYDNVNTVVADVTAGEDAFGIWVHGVVRRSATPEQVEALRASPLSGDWRPMDGGLELVAALAVNSGGFPIPRARVASGVPVALVAAGVVGRDESKTTPEITVEEVAAAVLAELDARGQRELALAELRADFADDLRSSFLDDARELLEWEFEFSISDEELSEFKKKNWVEKAGGLPKYIKRISKHLIAKGMDESRAIATAVNAAKKMCSEGDVNFPGKQQVNPGSRAEACAAVADWERKKAQS
jgi:2'-5' RNA ligase